MLAAFFCYPISHDTSTRSTWVLLYFITKKKMLIGLKHSRNIDNIISRTKLGIGKIFRYLAYYICTKASPLWCTYGHITEYDSVSTMIQVYLKIIHSCTSTDELSRPWLFASRSAILTVHELRWFVFGQFISQVTLKSEVILCMTGTIQLTWIPVTSI